MAEHTIGYPGPPTSGHYGVFDTAVDPNGVLWSCSVAGSAKAGGTAVFVSRSTDDDATITTPSVVSGTGFIPSATRRTELMIPVTHAGTVTLTAGPTLGTENAYLSTYTTVAGVVITKSIPAGWIVIVTLATSATIGTVTAQTI